MFLSGRRLDESVQPANADWMQDRVALAVAYEHGEGVPKDQPRAAALYCEEARRGESGSAVRARVDVRERSRRRPRRRAGRLALRAGRGAGHRPAQRAWPSSATPMAACPTA